MSLKKLAPLPKKHQAPKPGACHQKPAKKAPRRRPIAR
ncbi:hypothetical protein JOF29_005269 [Kribbella aluminosa]|uniref:Uncharacterized protein n=1 Tax=Kribbella aluminosa TaxID=416017 RepID=A0ABS4URE7_9ACTN|nr:hypothetical protein [Kribbella aluminosa]